jgi:hypothetical protein
MRRLMSVRETNSLITLSVHLCVSKLKSKGVREFKCKHDYVVNNVTAVF